MLNTTIRTRIRSLILFIFRFIINKLRRGPRSTRLPLYIQLLFSFVIATCAFVSFLAIFLGAYGARSFIVAVLSSMTGLVAFVLNVHFLVEGLIASRTSSKDHFVVERVATHCSRSSILPAVIILLAGISAYIALLTPSMPIAPILIAYALILLLVVDRKLLEFRVAHGFYGYNSMEAEEISRFLIHQAKGGDGGSQGKRGVFKAARQYAPLPGAVPDGGGIQTSH